MVVSVKLCDEGLMSSEGAFLGVHTFPIIFRETGSGPSGPQIFTEDLMETTIGTIATLSTRAVSSGISGHIHYCCITGCA